MSRFFWLVLCWATTCSSVVAQPGIERREQRLAAELVVLAGDVRRLQEESMGPLETAGLQKRLLGGLSSLPVTLRRAGGDAAVVIALRTDVDARRWPALAARLANLKQRYPFDVRPFLRGALTAEAREQGGRIHREVCGGCHDHPSTVDTLLPAKRLADQLKSMPREEFVARLWLGVRGDTTTAYANPFSEAELASLIGWYSNGQ